MRGLPTLLRPAWNRTVLVGAGLAGRTMRTVPGVGGALLVCYGLYDAYRPLGFLAAGAFLLLLDRRVS